LNLDSPGLDRLKSGSVRLVAPLIYSGELLGWLSLGQMQGERSYSLDDRLLLSRLAAQAAPVVQVALLVQQQQAKAAERERIEHEMRLAAGIQQSLLPKELPAPPGWKVAVHYQPAREVGGDFYDFICFEDGRLGVFVGDVTGKGVPAALLMATTRSILRAIAQEDVPPGETLRQANNILVNDVPPAMFVTCFYAVFSPATGELRCANAGHNLPFLRREGLVYELHARGMPLGLLPGQVYEERGYQVSPEEAVVLYSDGLVEAHDPVGDMFGEERMQAALARPFQDGEELNAFLLSTLANFTQVGWEQEDDITIVTLYPAALQ
jgi:serine phosphatase RsbU (regulator of sigma subunit)